MNCLFEHTEGGLTVELEREIYINLVSVLSLMNLHGHWRIGGGLGGEGGK